MRPPTQGDEVELEATAVALASSGPQPPEPHALEDLFSKSVQWAIDTHK